jgi:putative lipoprotein
MKRRSIALLPIAGMASIALVLGCLRGSVPDGTAEAPTDTMAAAGARTETPGPTPPPGPGSRSYFCQEEFRFVAQFEEGLDMVRLLLPDTTLTLPPVVSASGARYDDGTYGYWAKGDEALLEMPGRSYTGCVSDEGGPGWRDAKARGVRFRAVGQEPGWLLDVQADGAIDVEADYGEAVHHFPPVEPEVDPGAGRTIHRIETEAHRATIVIDDEPCRDAMSGWPFEATVTMVLDGREYGGCGRWL